MILPPADKLYAVIDATWPPFAKRAVGPWTIRIDGKGGSRVSAATAEQAVQDSDIPDAEAAMREVRQTPLFMIGQEDGGLDALLAARGYLVKDPVTLYAAPVAPIASEPPPPVTAFTVWPPLAVQADIWAAGGIGQGRLDVMDRARSPKTSLLGRVDDRPAGTVFVGIAADCAMIHALEIAPPHRRRGLAAALTRAAAIWARSEGADYLALVVTQANQAANRLYTSLGMTAVGQYHYRILPE